MILAENSTFLFQRLNFNTICFGSASRRAGRVGPRAPHHHLRRDVHVHDRARGLVERLLREPLLREELGRVLHEVQADLLPFPLADVAVERVAELDPVMKLQSNARE